mgnify:CR=1 FL=1
MIFEDFKRKVKNAYVGIDLSFSSNGAQHTAVVDEMLTLYNNAESDAIYGVMNGTPIGRCIGIE